MKTEKAKQLAADKAKQVQDLLKGGRDLATAAKAVGAEIKTSDMLTRGNHFTNVIARLKRGVSVASARKDLTQVADARRRETRRRSPTHES